MTTRSERVTGRRGGSGAAAVVQTETTEHRMADRKCCTAETPSGMRRACLLIARGGRFTSQHFVVLLRLAPALGALLGSQIRRCVGLFLDAVVHDDDPF